MKRVKAQREERQKALREESNDHGLTLPETELEVTSMIVIAETEGTNLTAVLKSARRGLYSDSLQ